MFDEGSPQIYPMTVLPCLSRLPIRTDRRASDVRPPPYGLCEILWRRVVNVVDGAQGLELDIRQARWVRWRAPVVMGALVLPFVGPVGAALFAGAALLGWFTRRSRRCRGEDYRLDLALAAGLCWIPLLTVIGSLGTGWGFYLLGEYPEQGVSVLGTTTIGTLLFILFVTWLLATHHSGENLFLWARDVDPVAAREQLRRARTATQWSVFERVDLLAARHAYEVGHGLTPAAQVTWFDAQRTALRYHWRLMATLLLPTVLWIGREAFGSDPSLSLMAWLGASILVVPLGVASTFQLTVTTHQGWAARERVLTSRIGYEGESSRWLRALAVLLGRE